MAWRNIVGLTKFRDIFSTPSPSLLKKRMILVFLSTLRMESKRYPETSYCSYII